MIITTNEHFRRRTVSYARKVQINYEEQGFNARMAELKTEWCSKRLELGLPIYKYENKYFKNGKPISEEEYNKWKDIPAFKDLLECKVVKINLFNVK